MLLVLAYFTWQANRTSMEQFFVENLQSDPHFFEAVKRAKGDVVNHLRGSFWSIRT